MKEGVEILIPKSKTDQGGEGQVCAIPYGNETLCPVTALIVWQGLANKKEGPVFYSQADHTQPIQPNQASKIIKALAKACQLPCAEKWVALTRRVATIQERGECY